MPARRPVSSTFFPKIKRCPNNHCLSYKVSGLTYLLDNKGEILRKIEKNIIQRQDYNRLWENTSNWDSLLYERAAISGKLVLSDFTKNALSQFKK